MLIAPHSLFLPNGVMGYKKVQSTRSTDFVQEMIAPHLSSYIEFYQVEKNYAPMKKNNLIVVVE